MLQRLEKGAKFVKNEYVTDEHCMEIVIKKSIIFWDNENAKGSNIDEFFKVINW